MTDELIAEDLDQLKRNLTAVCEGHLQHATILQHLLKQAWPPSLPVMRLHPDAILPTRGNDRAIGLDLYAYLPAGPVVVHVGTTAKIPTGIAAAIPNGYYGRVAPRSGLGLKQGIAILGGVIDEDYRGDISVMLHNIGWNALYDVAAGSFTVSHGDRIAQLVLERAAIVSLEEVAELPETSRGAKGFGSTGTR